MVEPVGQQVSGRPPERDPGHADLRLRPHQPLRHGRLGHQEGVRDLGRRQAGHEPQRQRHAGLGRERRVAAGEDQLQSVVGHGVLLLERVRVGPGGLRRERREPLAQRPLAAEAVDGDVPGRGDDPAERRARRTVDRPPGSRPPERLLHRLLGQVGVAEAAHERRDRASPVLAERGGGRLGRAPTAPPMAAPRSSRCGQTGSSPRPRWRRRSTRSRARSSPPAAPWSRRTGRR